MDLYFKDKDGKIKRADGVNLKENDRVLISTNKGVNSFKNTKILYLSLNSAGNNKECMVSEQFLQFRLEKKNKKIYEVTKITRYFPKYNNEKWSIDHREVTDKKEKKLYAEHIEKAEFIVNNHGGIQNKKKTKKPEENNRFSLSTIQQKFAT